MHTRPTTFILFGATGDLAVKKIFPAIASLLEEGSLHADSQIIAVSRRNFDTQGFRAFLKENWPAVPEGLLARITYADVDFDVRRGYENLKTVLQQHRNDLLIYLSLAPLWFKTVTEDLRTAGILERGTTKLLLEKPFGTDLDSARKLNEHLLSFLNQEQIYRVDHYLGKATVQAIMKTHEESASLREIISNETVEEITVELLETKGIDGRASYDTVGAFRDVGQNHVLATLATLLAEYPDKTEPSAWQHARAHVIESLRLPDAENCALRIGQYEGYQTEHGVSANSKTETAFELHTVFDSGELAGIPITFRAGKRMARQYAGMCIQFKSLEAFPSEMEFEIQPQPRMVLRHQNGTETEILFNDSRDAYHNILKDALSGETHHFAGDREIIAAWRFTDALLELFPHFFLETYSEHTPF